MLYTGFEIHIIYTYYRIFCAGHKNLNDQHDKKWSLEYKYSQTSSCINTTSLNISVFYCVINYIFLPLGEMTFIVEVPIYILTSVICISEMFKISELVFVVVIVVVKVGLYIDTLTYSMYIDRYLLTNYTISFLL